MSNIFVSVGREKVSVDKNAFKLLLDIAPFNEQKSFIDVIQSNNISLAVLKKIALRAGIPYPLFFAPYDIVKKQSQEKEKHLYTKIPSKSEIKLSSRGRVELKDIELIVKDLGRKQEFLKNRVLFSSESNKFIGSLSRKVKQNTPISELALEIRKMLNIDLEHLRSIPKTKVLEYIRTCAENNNILISFSSHNYMPQNLKSELELSGICIKDNKFPYIFINTRDGDSNPKILESEGRQIFTLLAMLSCVAIGVFVLSSKNSDSKKDNSRLPLSIAGEIIVPENDLGPFKGTTLDQLKELAHYFRVTPSMILYQLIKQDKIDKRIAKSFQQQIRVEIVKANRNGKQRGPSPVTAFSKYNGQKFSKEIVRAFDQGKINQVEFNNILFRLGNRIDSSLIRDYRKKYRVYQ